MSFSRLWNYVSGWNPFKNQDPSRANDRTSSSAGTSRSGNQTSEPSLETLEAEHKQNLYNLLDVVYHELTAQLTAEREYRGDVVHTLVLQTIQRVAQEYIPGSPPFKSELKEKEIVSSRVTLNDRFIPASDSGLTEDDINKSMQAFEKDFNIGGENLAVEEEPEVEEEIREEVLVSETAHKTGFTGNPFYSEELNRAAITDHKPYGTLDADRAAVTDDQSCKSDLTVLEDDSVDDFSAQLQEIVKETHEADARLTEETDSTK